MVVRYHHRRRVRSLRSLVETKSAMSPPTRVESPVYFLYAAPTKIRRVFHLGVPRLYCYSVVFAPQQGEPRKGLAVNRPMTQVSRIDQASHHIASHHITSIQKQRQNRDPQLVNPQ